MDKNYPNIVGVTAPYFRNGHTSNQYVLYTRQRVYFKFCFLAYLSLLASDSTDRPEAEELVAALLRRSDLEHRYEKDQVATFKEGWDLLPTLQFGDTPLNGLANKDISLLGQWLMFLVNHGEDLKKVGEFRIAVSTVSASDPNRKYHGIYATIPSDKSRSICIYFGRSAKIECGFELLNRANHHAEEEASVCDEDIWFNGHSNVKAKLELDGITSEFRDALSSARTRQLTLQSWRIDFLSNWLQRHSSGEQTSASWNAPHGGISAYVGRPLRELTRADIGATIYRLDYGEHACPLRIVADDSGDPAVLLSVNDRQEELDQIRIQNRANAKDHSYCYQSVEDNRFLYIEKADENKAMCCVGPIMVMPLHMEQRLMGIIEVSGTQPKHFRWSQRLLLKQVASVLAPYFYRQQVLPSFQNISRRILDFRAISLKGVIGQRRHQYWLRDVCGELCRIFLYRMGTIWLASEDRRDRFDLTNAHDDSDFIKKYPRNDDGKVTFWLKAGSTGIRDGSNPFLLVFAQEHAGEGGITLPSGKLFVKRSNLLSGVSIQLR